MGSFGTEISGNRRPRAELSSEMRAAILHGLEKQISPTQMAKEFHYTLKLRPCSGRPHKLSPSAKHYIYQIKALVAYTPGGSLKRYNLQKWKSGESP
ncbi:hypothetical protein V8F44DRAFT_633206 [Aspergillus fumigatus]